MTLMLFEDMIKGEIKIGKKEWVGERADVRHANRARVARSAVATTIGNLGLIIMRAHYAGQSGHQV
jgi:hypothetical protein